MKYRICDCGAMYNPETTLKCPICMGTGKAPQSLETEDSNVPPSKTKERLKRGKAVRGTVIGAEIRELLRVHRTSTVAKMMKGKVGRTVVYNIAQEEKIKRETLAALVSAHGGLYRNLENGQYRLGSQSAPLMYAYLRNCDAYSTITLPVGCIPIYIDDEIYDEFMDEIIRAAKIEDH